MARFDFRMDDDLLERVRVIADEVFNAPKHHITGKTQITDALNKIIELGVIQIESGNYTGTQHATLPDSYLDTITDRVVERVKAEMAGKIDRLEMEIERLSQAVESGFNTDKDTDTSEDGAMAIGTDSIETEEIPLTGINRDSLSPIFEESASNDDKPLSNKSVGEIIGVDGTTIGRWLKGQKPTRRETKDKHTLLHDRYRHTPDGWIEK